MQPQYCYVRDAYLSSSCLLLFYVQKNAPPWEFKSCSEILLLIRRVTDLRNNMTLSAALSNVATHVSSLE